MQTKRSHEGYLLIDNRNSPGVTKEFVRSTGRHAPVVGEGAVLEANTITCAHCQRGVILNPQRSHRREWCSYCDHYLCDNCGLIKKIDGKCRNLNQLFDKLQEQLASGERTEHY